MSLFAPATKATVKARIGLAGPTGSGKTYTALRLGAGLAGPDGKTAVIDTERGSASLYSDTFVFDVAVMNPPFQPAKYQRALDEAAHAGYEVLVIDSITHAWSGDGGILDIVDDEARRNQSGNKFAAWKVGSEQWRALLDAILGAPLHVIVTMRSKMDYVQEKDSRGRTEIRKVGMAPEARDGIEYEFTLVGDLDQAHRLLWSKSRIAALADRVVDRPGEALGTEIRAWLSDDPPQPDHGFSSPAPTPSAPISASEPDPSSEVGLTDHDFGLLAKAGCGDEAFRHALVSMVTDGRTNSSRRVTTAERDRLREVAEAMTPNRDGVRAARLVLDGPGGQPVLLDADDAPVDVAELPAGPTATNGAFTVEQAARFIAQHGRGGGQ